jgi:hypothetical protein
MKLSTKDCTTYIGNWVLLNTNSLPIDDYAKKLKDGGDHPWISDGTKYKDWKRRGKKNLVNGDVLRVFDCDCSIFISDCYILVKESDGKIVHIEQDTAENLSSKYDIVIKII